MATHKVTLRTPPLEIGRADISLAVKRNGRILGELKISNGSAVWFPNGNTYGYKLGWSKLAELFEDHGTKRAESR
jgi:hypothetical protein